MPCRFGDACNFAHGGGQLRRARPSDRLTLDRWDTEPWNAGYTSEGCGATECLLSGAYVRSCPCTKPPCVLCP